MNYVYYNKGDYAIDLPLSNDRYYEALEECLMREYGITEAQASAMIQDIPVLEDVITEDMNDLLMEVLEDDVLEYIREQEQESRYDETIRYSRAI